MAYTVREGREEVAEKRRKHERMKEKARAKAKGKR